MVAISCFFTIAFLHTETLQDQVTNTSPSVVETPWEHRLRNSGYFLIDELDFVMAYSNRASQGFPKQVISPKPLKLSRFGQGSCPEILG